MTNNLWKANFEERTYYIRCDDGYSCLGFEVCQKWTEGIAKWLGIFPPPVNIVGTAQYYAEYLRLCQLGERKHANTGLRCNALLHPDLIGLEGKLVEVTQQNEKRRFVVGKSTGWMPTHLELDLNDLVEAQENYPIGGSAVSVTSYDFIRVISVSAKQSK